MPLRRERCYLEDRNVPLCRERCYLEDRNEPLCRERCYLEDRNEPLCRERCYREGGMMPLRRERCYYEIRKRQLFVLYNKKQKIMAQKTLTTSYLAQLTTWHPNVLAYSGLSILSVGVLTCVYFLISL